MTPEQLQVEYLYWQGKAENAIRAADYANGQLRRICQEMGAASLRLVETIPEPPTLRLLQGGLDD